jgi:hypothetical protein
LLKRIIDDSIVFITVYFDDFFSMVIGQYFRKTMEETGKHFEINRIQDINDFMG